MATKDVRSALLLRTCLEILRDRGVRMPKREVHAVVAERVDLTDAEQAPGRDGVPRWVTHIGYHTSVAASVGFMVKMDSHWSITEAGLAALELHPSADELLSHTWRRYREILAGRQRSDQRHEASHATIAEALDRVPRGAWTAFEDLAALADATVDEVAELLVAGEDLPTSHRVLTLDGEVPLPAMVHPSHRGADLRARLIAEGVEFYGVRANPDQRVPVEILRDTFADQPAEPAGLAGTPGHRGWRRPALPVARRGLRLPAGVVAPAGGAGGRRGGAAACGRRRLPARGLSGTGAAGLRVRRVPAPDATRRPRARRRGSARWRWRAGRPAGPSGHRRRPARIRRVGPPAPTCAGRSGGSPGAAPCTSPTSPRRWPC